MDSERSRLSKLQTEKEKSQKNLQNFMRGFFEEQERPIGSVFKNEAGDTVMNWVSAPHYMHEFMPDREDPKHVYGIIRKMLMTKTKTVTLENCTELLR